MANLLKQTPCLNPVSHSLIVASWVSEVTGREKEYTKKMARSFMCSHCGAFFNHQDLVDEDLKERSKSTALPFQAL